MVIEASYFCTDETVTSAYVSSYGSNATIGDDDDFFNEWYTVPDVESTISYETLLLMLKSHKGRPMYWFGPIEGKKPNIP